MKSMAQNIPILSVFLFLVFFPSFTLSFFFFFFFFSFLNTFFSIPPRQIFLSVFYCSTSLLGWVEVFDVERKKGLT